jgi:predicted MFS family arabinose efflux permease
MKCEFSERKKKMNQRKVMIATLAMVIVGIAALAFSPVYAYSNGVGIAFQGTPLPGDAMSTGIPNTGGNVTDPAGLSWVIWAILGISVLALLIALVTRGTARRDL